MAFWLVYQGTSWDRARAGGYLWAPKRGKLGQTPVHWANMERIQPGELIFSGVSNALRAVSEAALPAYTAPRPDPRDDEHWDGDGWRLDVAYTDLPRPLPYLEWVPSVLALMQARHSAFSGGGRPNQGYLFELPVAVGERVLAMVAASGTNVAEAAGTAAALPAGGATERQMLASARIGQGSFRQHLLETFKGRCAVSGIERPELLRASHIKPWAGSSNAERLDPANGLLLSAIYDAAFDARLISFGDEGEMLFAEGFSPEEAQAAGINPAARLSRPSSATALYLAQHRELMKARYR